MPELVKYAPESLPATIEDAHYELLLSVFADDDVIFQAVVPVRTYPC